MEKKKFKVEFVVEGHMIRDAFLQEKVPLNNANINNSLEKTFEAKGDIGGTKIGDCKLSKVQVKEI